MRLFIAAGVLSDPEKRLLAFRSAELEALISLKDGFNNLQNAQFNIFPKFDRSLALLEGNAIQIVSNALSRIAAQPLKTPCEKTAQIISENSQIPVFSGSSVAQA